MHGTMDVLDEVELGDAVAHRAQHTVAVGRKEHIALRVHRAAQVLELHAHTYRQQ